jgi:hypothetical protein
MQLEHFALQLEKLSQQCGINYSLGEPASEDDISQAEEKLGVSFPSKVSLFYKSFNGLRVENPQLEVLPIEQLNFVFPNRLHFATIDGKHRLYFDTSQINVAGQWNILAEDGYCVTLTMPAFWSSYIWKWVKSRRVIWEEEIDGKWKIQSEEVCEEKRAT